MTDGMLLMLAVQVAGHLITVAALLVSNARQSGRAEEKIRGIGRALDTHREVNARDHARYDAHIARVGHGAD